MKGLLISYAGIPYTPSSLMPDNGLASLAAASMQTGCEIEVMDYGSLEIIKYVQDNNIFSKLKEIYDKKMSNEFGEAEINELRKLEIIIDQKRESFENNLIKKISEKISKKNISFLGFKLWNGDGYTGAIRIITALKSMHPSIPIIVGGSHVYIFYDILLNKNKSIDYLCYGEGEKTIQDFISYLKGDKQIEDVSNLIYLQEGKLKRNKISFFEDLNTLPMPIYSPEIYPSFNKDLKILMPVIDESRGCVFNCGYCIETSKYADFESSLGGKKWRKKSAERIVQEMKYFKDNFDINLIRFGGELTPGTLLENVAKILLENNENFEFSAFSHVRTNMNTNFDLLKKAGLYSLFFGIESGSQRILDRIESGKKEKNKVSDMEMVLKRAMNSGIKVAASIIFPLPGDNKETMRETIDFMLRVRPDFIPIQFLGIYPHSIYYRNAEEFGIELDKSTYSEKVIDYKIKTLFPPHFWDPLPFKIDGKDFNQFVRETETLYYILEYQNGLIMDITDEQSLLAKHAQLSDIEFRDKIRELFFILDYNGLHDLVIKINESQKNGK